VLIAQALSALAVHFGPALALRSALGDGLAAIFGVKTRHLLTKVKFENQGIIGIRKKKYRGNKICSYIYF